MNLVKQLICVVVISNISCFVNRNYSELLNPKPSIEAPLSGEVPFKKLNDIMKLDLLHDKNAKEIENIWLEYHKQKDDVLVATIPTEVHNLLVERSKEFPIFILPLPRSQGYEFFLLQFASNSVHFTPLLCYQVRKSICPCTRIELRNWNYLFHFFSLFFWYLGSQGERSRMSQYCALHRV